MPETMEKKWTERICKQCGTVRILKKKSVIKDLCPNCANLNRRTSRNKLPNDKAILRRLYWDEKMSMNRLGEMFNVGPGIVDARLKELGIVTRTQAEGQLLRGEKNSGINNPNYRNGRTQNGPDGYVFILKPEHPKAKQGYVSEHLLVWEQSHGKQLPKGWLIHHLNGIKNDNRPENLEAMEVKTHVHLISKLQSRIRYLESQLYIT